MVTTLEKAQADATPVRKPKLLDLVQYPDEILTKKSAYWVGAIKNSPDLQGLIDDMELTVRATGALGLSAVQVGILSRIFTIRDGSRILTFVNPEVKAEGELTFLKEGCLSFPRAFECVQRLATATVKGTDRNGEPLEVKLTGDAARAAQHEFDHLEGVLFIDKMSFVKRQAALKAVKIFKRRYQ